MRKRKHTRGEKKKMGQKVQREEVQERAAKMSMIELRKDLEERGFVEKILKGIARLPWGYVVVRVDSEPHWYRWFSVWGEEGEEDYNTPWKARREAIEHQQKQEGEPA